MADEGDLILVLVFGTVLMIYSLLFYLCDHEYRNNFQGGSHSYADSNTDEVAVQWNAAKDQFNQLAFKLEKLKVYHVQNVVKQILSFCIFVRFKEEVVQ